MEDKKIEGVESTEVIEMKLPLVSIKIPSFNYGRYLGNCLDSVLNQTYPNIEVLFRDNNSEDDSFEIALSYRHKFEEKGFYYDVAKNKRNLGSDRNTARISGFADGRFHFVLGCDDSISPTFIESCMELFLKYPELSTVITHREEIDENNNKRLTPPFYNKNCVIEGKKQAAVYMMAGIAVPVQRMFDVRKLTRTVGAYYRQYLVAGDWAWNYLYSLVGDVAYIKEPLCQYRTHFGNETNESELNLLGIMEHFSLINEFYNAAKALKIDEVLERREIAIEKLGSMCMRYAVKMLYNNLHDVANKYLLLAPVYKLGIEKEDIYKEIKDCLTMKGDKLNDRLQAIENTYNVNRTVSYDPPEEHKEFELEGIKYYRDEEDDEKYLAMIERKVIIKE